MSSHNVTLAIAAAVLLSVAAPNSLAKRYIYGYITMPDGTPAKGVGVIAWDQDNALLGGGKNDHMVSGITDGRGYYRMQYKGKPWDTKVPGSTSFRPDIFLTVHAVQAGLLPVKRTTVKTNWKMAKDLRWDIRLPGIMGRILGAPASGLKIVAYDSDGLFAGKDDPIGVTRTMPDGRYMMLYGGKHYDSTPPSPGGIVGGVAEAVSGVLGIGYILKRVVDIGWDGEMHKRWTSWRPDIYIKVYANPPRLSRVFNNWPHRNTLVINMDLRPKPGPAGRQPQVPSAAPGGRHVK